MDRAIGCSLARDNRAHQTGNTGNDDRGGQGAQGEDTWGNLDQAQLSDGLEFHIPTAFGPRSGKARGGDKRRGQCQDESDCFRGLSDAETCHTVLSFIFGRTGFRVVFFVLATCLGRHSLQKKKRADLTSEQSSPRITAKGELEDDKSKRNLTQARTRSLPKASFAIQWPAPVCPRSHRAARVDHRRSPGG